MENKTSRNFSKIALTWIAWLAVIGGVGFGGWRLSHRVLNSSTRPVSVRFIKANKGTVEDIINESGIIELGEQQLLKAPVEGTVTQIYTKLGAYVKENQELILLKDAQQQNSLSEYQLKLQELNLDLESKQQRVAKEQGALAVVQKKLQADETLFARGFISENELQTQRDKVTNSQATLAEAEQAVRRAMLQLELLQLQGTQLQKQINQNLVVAPGNGKILEVKVQKGNVVERGDPLLTIGNPQQELVRLELSILNASKVKLGLPARISIIGISPEIFTGQVRSLSLIAKKTGSQNQATVSAIVELDNPSGKLIPGSQVSVDIILERYQDVIILPTQAIQRNGTVAFVWVQDEQGKAQQQPITIGMEGINTIAVESGLNTGAQVIVPLENLTLKPGMTVQGIQN